ncbi:MAG: PLP-dependent aminotransferase family protein [Firmicutes bacterium]|nr:PLP-dependent aminotransferase family protein [Bacillota bacterium]
MPYNSFDDYPMSWRPVLKRGEAPLYITLADKLEEDIASGVLKAGTKLPPQRELADFLDINLSTVARAFKICSDKGLLNGSVGSGTFISYHMVSKMKPAENSTIDLGGIMPADENNDEIRTLISEMMNEDDFGSVLQYRSGKEYWQNEAGTVLLKQAKCNASADKIIFASGGQNAIAATLLGIFKPGDRLGVDPLVYPGIISIASMLGIRLIPIRQENGEMSEEGIRYAVKNDGIKGIYIIPDYQNPTMHRMSESCRDMIAKMAEENDFIIIEDGYAALLTDEPRDSIYSRIPEHSIFFLSLSKCISSALRQSYMITPDKYRDVISNAFYNINLESSAFLSEIAARLVLSGKYETLLHRRKIMLAERNHIAEEILGGFNIKGDSNALCKWLTLPSGTDSAEFEKRALEKNVLIYGSSHFAVGKSAPVSGARLSICTPKTGAELARALTILREILETEK